MLINLCFSLMQPESLVWGKFPLAGICVWISYKYQALPVECTITCQMMCETPTCAVTYSPCKTNQAKLWRIHNNGKTNGQQTYSLLLPTSIRQGRVGLRNWLSLRKSLPKESLKCMMKLPRPPLLVTKYRQVYIWQKEDWQIIHI